MSSEVRPIDRGRAVRALLDPRSIAIIGATPDRNKLSGRPQHFLERDGYAGDIWPVNPRYPEIGGRKCYPDVASLPAAPDLAIVAVAAARAGEVVAALGDKGCPVAALFSSGFGEMGEAGKKLEADLAETARRHGIRLCGPNTLGLVNAFARMPATFSQYADDVTVAGPCGFASQSGAFGTAISALARSRGLGFGYFVSTGNTADITPAECLSQILEDERIRVAAGYIEGIGLADDLLAVAEKSLRLEKPFVLVKVGREAAGARAAASHTGSLAGEDRVFDAVIRQHGILRARNEEHLLDMMSALATNVPPTGRGLALITQSGGAGVLMADRAEEIGLAVPQLAPETRAGLGKVLPEFGATQNPIDVTGAFLSDPKIMAESVRLALDDPKIDVAVIWLQLMHGYADALVELFRTIKREVRKPFLVCWIEAPEKARKALMADGICVISATERVVDAAAGLIAWGEVLAREKARAAPRPALTALRAPAVGGKSEVVGSIEAEAMLRAAGLEVVASRLARSPDEAATVAAALGFPVAVKIESRDIPHKTEAEGVVLGLKSEADVRAAAGRVIAAARRHEPDAVIEGVLVQRMAEPGTELVFGLRRDPAFGHVAMVGLGGIFVEVLRDVAFARCPLDETDALAMIDSLKARAVLDGARGRPKVDRSKVAAALIALSRLAAAHPEIDELDLNPVFAGPDGVVAVDWLMVRRRPA